MRTVGAVLVPMVLSLATSCATQHGLPQRSSPNAAFTAPPPSLSAAPRTSAEPAREVRASYQGSAQAGRLTASGEPYDPNGFTAASRTLPIGSSVIVTNSATGRSVKVRINDRGPYAGSRSLDLSKRAAEKIGLTSKGIARVEVKRVDSKPETREPPTSSENSSSTPNSDR
ncbi:MAG TPA: septal ring lytic transglycosylase RlpA family protein [Candidatus Binataceae bacterium]|nr:septal ring lytic transglycosylase RlpA family protein [Candidatus Binataceae bacterium]